MKFKYYTALLLITVVTSCEPDLRKEEVVANYASLVLTNYQSAYKDVNDLKKTIKELTVNPSEGSHQKAKKAWLKARESYGVTEAFRFQEGPIDMINGIAGPEANLNAWPLDESYVDYVKGDSLAGIINDTTIIINKENLLSANEAGGEENISVGYHAIEFLLWGQDLTSPHEKHAGNRPFTDFVDAGTASNQGRRRQYLMICADLLLENLQLLIDQWEEGGAYQTKFLAMEPNHALGKMMTGIATLSKAELAGERIFVAYDNKDQEDEHSCFSDNTHRDARLNLQGVYNVYFANINGKAKHSIHTMLKLQDAKLADDVKAAFDKAEKAVNATAIPFDYAISDNDSRPKVLEAVKSLRILGDKIVEAGMALDLEVGNDLPE